MFPVRHQNLWSLYKNQLNVFWVPEEIDLSADPQDFEEKLNSDERYFIKNVLAFFNQSDGIINENLCVRFYKEVLLAEARAFYAIQIAIEAIHAETYSLLLETYVRDSDEKNKLFNAIETIPAIKQKAEWALAWMENAEASLAQRLFAFAIIEGVFFSGSFCSIFWLRKRGLMPGLCKANDFISRDEGLHWTFAAELFKTLDLKKELSIASVKKIINEAVKIEQNFICHSLPVDLVGMNKELMSQYIQYTADRVLNVFGYEKIHNVDNPFPFMALLDLENKSNFFETRVSEYSKGANKQLDFDADF
jgi:ribonucleotide reductase beta subunit family protein with ferritin-like domain